MHGYPRMRLFWSLLAFHTIIILVSWIPWRPAFCCPSRHRGCPTPSRSLRKDAMVSTPNLSFIHSTSSISSPSTRQGSEREFTRAVPSEEKMSTSLPQAFGAKRQRTPALEVRAAFAACRPSAEWYSFTPLLPPGASGHGDHRRSRTNDQL
jgi:hypothetical protein